MRNKLSDKLQEFVTNSEREAFITKLQETEDWLYEDGEDCVAKLEELKKQGDAIEERYKEHTERGPVIDQLANCVNSYRGAAASSYPWFDHIDLADKEKVLKECAEAEAWLRAKKQQQDSLPKHATPVLLSADVKRKIETLNRFCGPVMMKPKPEAAKPATVDTNQSSDSSFSFHILEKQSEGTPKRMPKPLVYKEDASDEARKGCRQVNCCCSLVRLFGSN